MATTPSKRFFSHRQIDEQIHDDLEAGYLIPAILMATMIFGLVTMLISVWLTI